MKLLTYLALAAGVALFFFLLIHFGAKEVVAGTAAAGWGLLWVTLYRFASVATDTLGWRALFSGKSRPRMLPVFQARWIGEAVNSLLPVAQVGGDVVRAQMARRMGIRGAEAGATVVVDFTLGLVTQLLYTLLGVALVMQTRGAGTETRLWTGGLLVAAAVIGAFWAAQHLQLFGRVARLAGKVLRGKTWMTITGGAAALDAQIRALYGRRRALATCAGWRMTSWLVRSGETWLALYFLGSPIGLVGALVLESLSNAVRSGGFAVPGALGIHEGGMVLLGPLVGVSPETALALALVKRFREVAVGAGGLAVWGASEAVARKPVPAPEGEGTADIQERG